MDGTGVNGATKRKLEIKRPATWEAALLPAKPNKWRIAVTIVAGCAIPIFSLYFAAQSGYLLKSGSAGREPVAILLGVVFFVLCFTVLAVSLSHLARAFRDITGLASKSAWALAMSLDCALAASELTDVAGYGWALVYVFMVAVTAFSMALNCWTMLHHRE
jgi:hypothetical protein